jgi:hypothetical protein
MKVERDKSTGGLAGGAAYGLYSLGQLLESLFRQGVLVFVWVQLFGQPSKVLHCLLAHHTRHACDNHVYGSANELINQKHLFLVSLSSAEVLLGLSLCLLVDLLLYLRVIGTHTAAAITITL